MLVSSAIEDYGAAPANYFMIDAAVAAEAYDRNVSKEPWMRNSDWYPDYGKAYEEKLFASEWYLCFPAGDGRNRLTWRDRFRNPGGTLGAGPTKVYNFYSSSEDVLAAHTDREPSTDLGLLFDIGTQGRSTWALQEKLKGRQYNTFLANALAKGRLGSLYGGWTFNQYYNVPPPRISLADANALTLQQLQTHPFFDPGYEQKHDGSTGGVWGPAWMPSLFDPQQGSAIASDYSKRAILLAEDFPSYTLAAGGPGGALLSQRFRENHDMADEFESDNGSEKMWPRPRDEWWHNDFRVVAYSYQYKLFDYIVSKIGK